ncbi:MAG: hypothetical protein CMLOHMNK_02905 [Steroidobacteraceae bacterium]|nr:hypothetical protein [Steroidobacteraceae bacterium]
MSELREKIVALFERHRVSPGDAFDPEHFLDFLIASPRAGRAVYNQFSGLRRFNRFIDAVQLECAVCFSRKDRDANYSLDKFVDRIEELQRSPRGSLASLRNQIKVGPEVNFVLFVNLILLSALVAIRHNFWGLCFVVGLAVAFNLWYVGLYASGKKYQGRLRQRILSAYGIVDQ